MKPASDYRPDIDGLRAIAVLVVLFYHAALPGFGGGFVGVDVFFVISGFLITSFLINQVMQTGKIAFLDFYAKRIRRLLPAITLVVFSSLVFWSLFLIGVPEDTGNFTKSIRYSLFGLANFYFQFHTGGYFDGPSEQMPLLHFWSLAVEEQFYFLWPILVFSTLRVSVKRLVFTLCLLSILSFAFTILLMSIDQRNFAFYAMPARAWELGIGALLATLVTLKQTINLNANRLQSEFFAWIGLAFIVFAVAFTNVKNFPGWISLLPVIGTAFVIWAGTINKNHSLYFFLSSKPMIKTGLLSYGIYLWHWPLFAIARTYNMGEMPSIQYRLIAIALSFLLAGFSLKYFESPIRSGRYFNNWKPKKIIAHGALVSLLLVFLSLLVRYQEFKNTQKNIEFSNMLNERSAIYPLCSGNQTIGKKLCTLDFSGGLNNKQDLVVWGSSHAGTIFPMLEEYSLKHGHTVTLMMRGGGAAGLLYGSDFFIEDETKTNEMNDFNNRAFKQIESRVKTVGQGVSVLLVPRWMQYSGQKTFNPLLPISYADRAQSLQGTRNVIRDAVVRTFQSLSDIGVRKILVMLPYPEFKYNVMRCAIRSQTVCATSRSELDLYRQEMVSIILNEAKRFPNVRTFDPIEKLCDQEKCLQVMKVNNKRIPMVVDTDHPSAEMARILGAKIKAELDWFAEN